MMVLVCVWSGESDVEVELLELLEELLELLEELAATNWLECAVLVSQREVVELAV